MMRVACRLLVAVAMFAAVSARSGAQAPVYLSDRPDLILSSTQGWGELGIDSCAHAPGVAALPIQLGQQVYRKGLGHHAPGEIVVDLGGQFQTFEATVGVQWQQGNTGSVVFRVLVDGQVRYDSKIMREKTPAQSIRVPVRGAQEMRLVLTDAGDGITCDCGDWAEARLTPDPSAKARSTSALFDVAPYARVATWDPARMDGARSSRIQEFHAEDLFLETELVPRQGGGYLAPSWPGGKTVIGLQWLERRKIATLTLAPGAGAPASVDGVRVEAWVGETTMQGGWQPIAGTVTASGGVWTLDVDPRTNPSLSKGTCKIRWIVPCNAGGLEVRTISALTRASMETVRLRFDLVHPRPGLTATVSAYNGWFGLRDKPGTIQKAWSLDRPLVVDVTYAVTRSTRANRTVMRIELPDTAFGVAVDDILNAGTMVVRRSGLVVHKVTGRTGDETVPLVLSSLPPDGKTTVLERVRRMPDQTLARAMARTRNPIQDNGPTMISLACDNRKWVVERDGTVTFGSAAIVPRLGTAKQPKISRHLQRGWLPAPTTIAADEGIEYSECAYVIPTDATRMPSAPLWLDRKPVCVLDYRVTNTRATIAYTTVALRVLADAARPQPASLRYKPGGIVADDRGKLLAVVETAGAAPMTADWQEGTVRLMGAIAPRSSVHFRVLIPGYDLPVERASEVSAPAEGLDALQSYWMAALAPAAQITVPDGFVTNLIRASQVHCLIAARNEDEGRKVAPWIASMSYGPLESEANSVIHGMDLMGHQEFARRSLDYFIGKYDPSGMLTTGYTLVGHGWHLWTLGQHYQITRDRDWLSSVAPRVTQACEWVARQTEKTRRRGLGNAKQPVYGLMPPGVLADWNAFAYYYSLNGFYCAGLRDAADALADVGVTEARDLRSSADALRDETLRAFAWTRARTPVLPLQNGLWTPAYPTQVYTPGPIGDYFPGEDSNRSWCYDIELGAHHLITQGVLDPQGPEADDIVDNMEDVAFLSDGWFDYPAEASHKDWFDRGGFSKVQPYYTRNAQIYAMRDDVKPFVRSYFNTLAAMVNTENMSMWEHFHNGGAYNKTHETGYFLEQSRLMLVQERGTELWLAPMVTCDWLQDGQQISVQNAPTAFGPVSFAIKSAEKRGYVEAVIDTPTRQVPSAIVVRLRHPRGRKIERVMVNGVAHTDLADPCSVRIANPRGRLTIRAEY